MAKVTNSPAPDHLTMNLFAPGMSALHRAGLGGLACTLKAMERQYEAGLLKADKLPAPIDGAIPPWEIDERSVTLRFGKPERAKKYLERLFAFAFQIQDGMVFLPGQYGDVPPSMMVRSELQSGLLLTLYDHGPQSRGVREVFEQTQEVDDKPISFRAARLEWYKHQRDGAAIAIGSLTEKMPLSRMLFPGAIVRHDRFKGSAVELGSDLLLPLLFAPVGVFGLRMGAKKVTVRGKRIRKHGAVLVVPVFSTLLEVHNVVPAIIPREPQSTRIGSMGDAVLSAEIRLQAAGRLNNSDIENIRCIWCCAADWQSQLQPPSSIVEVNPSSITSLHLHRYAIAAARLPPRVKTIVVEASTGKGKARIVSRREEHYLSDSVVRPLCADNLAQNRPWYRGFFKLMTKTNPATDKPYRNQLSSERKGLNDMIQDKTMWDHQGDCLVVKAVHDAMRRRYAQIAKENKDKPTAMKSRMRNFREKLRLDLAGAKTSAQVRFALMNLFSRAGYNSILRDEWQQVLPVIRRDWTLARDLGLLGLASYVGQGITEETDAEIETNPNEE